MFGTDFVKSLVIDSLEVLAQYVLESEFSSRVPATKVVTATSILAKKLDQDKVCSIFLKSQICVLSDV